MRSCHWRTRTSPSRAERGAGSHELDPRASASPFCTEEGVPAPDHLHEKGSADDPHHRSQPPTARPAGHRPGPERDQRDVAPSTRRHRHARVGRASPSRGARAGRGRTAMSMVLRSRPPDDDDDERRQRAKAYLTAMREVWEAWWDEAEAEYRGERPNRRPLAELAREKREQEARKRRGKR